MNSAFFQNLNKFFCHIFMANESLRFESFQTKLFLSIRQIIKIPHFLLEVRMTEIKFPEHLFLNL